MARGKKVAQRRKRMVKRISKRSRGYKTISIVGKSLNPIPQRYICKMKYAETVSTNVVGLYTFNLNSIFDPNQTGTGHQPYAHDTLQSLYNRYRVISCSYRVICNRNDATTQLIALPANEIISYTTASEYKENPRGRYVTQSPGGNVVPLSGKVYLPSLVGRTKTQYMSDDRFQAAFGNSPAELAMLNLGAFSASDVPASGVALNVELVYTVECFDVKNLAQS